MKELDQEYGKALTPKQLADFLGIDPRTVLKYRDRWGGVQVSPGIWRFFEKTIKEVINNVVHQEPQRQEEIRRHRACNPFRTVGLFAGKRYSRTPGGKQNGLRKSGRWKNGKGS